MAKAIRMGAEIYWSLKKVLLAKGYGALVGDEGGFAPAVGSNRETFEILMAAVRAAGYQPGREIIFGIDAAASEFYQDGVYQLKKEGRVFSRTELGNFYEGLQAEFPIYSWEDIFSEDDWDGFHEFTQRHGAHRQIVGDDLYVTDRQRLARGIKEGTSNSILIKLNQVGTLSETIATVLDARSAGLTAVVSNRSGETEDAFIADLSVALGTGQIKTGAPARAERTAKYNRLLEIAAALGTRASYAVFPFPLK
jgi:enolase